MKEFTTTDLTRNFSEVGHSATREPVAIVQRGKARWVLMSVEDFRARHEQDPRQVHRMNELPEDVASAMLEAFDEFQKPET